MAMAYGKAQQQQQKQDDDVVPVAVSEDLRETGLAAVEFPLAVRPSSDGIEKALSMIGGIQQLATVAADAVSVFLSTRKGWWVP